MSNFNNAARLFKEAVKDVDISDGEVELLLNHNRIINVFFPVRLSDGSIKIFEGYRIQHNNARGPYKGGIRFHPEVDMDEVKSLSFWMSIKTAAVDIPMGGGKGGIKFNPKDYSEEDIEKISRAFVRHIADLIGSDKDIPAPDVYTNPKIMGIMLDEYNKVTGKNDPAAFTGKDQKDGGLTMRGYSTSMGGAFILRKIMKDEGKDPGDVSVAIQGMGNAGSNMAKLLSDWGYRIVALSDSKGAVYNKEGIDVEKAIKHKKENRTVKGLENTEGITNEALLEMDVDVLVPSALGGVITTDNASNVKADYVIELANGPTTNEADDMLYDNDVMVIPDVLANAGGVVGSYFEWRNNKQGLGENEDKEVKELEDVMLRAYDDMKKTSFDNKCSLRNAAYILASKRIIEAEKKRGNI
ncbi:MAG: Glu/Leu/Phe/Val family dehydrogenase [Nanobdellota archaeon]